MTRQLERAAAALALVLAVWSVLLARFFLEPHVGGGAAICGTFLAATLLVLATRPSSPGPRPVRVSALALGGCVAAFASYPAWIALIAGAGVLIGLAPATPPPPARDPLLLLSTLVLAPLFEEALYRERLLPALAKLGGWPAALVLSSALFALPHLEAWSVLGTFLVGLALGASLWRSGSLAFCIGAHAGLNLGAALCGLPPGEGALPPTAALVVGGALWIGTVEAARIGPGGGASPRQAPARRPTGTRPGRRGRPGAAAPQSGPRGVCPGGRAASSSTAAGGLRFSRCRPAGSSRRPRR